MLEFEGGELRVGSTIAPDEADGSRFNFAFEQCSLTWRALKVPLPAKDVQRRAGDKFRKALASLSQLQEKLQELEKNAVDDVLRSAHSAVSSAKKPSTPASPS